MINQYNHLINSVLLNEKIDRKVIKRWKSLFTELIELFKSIKILLPWHRNRNFTDFSLLCVDEFNIFCFRIFRFKEYHLEYLYFIVSIPFMCFTIYTVKKYYRIFVKNESTYQSLRKQCKIFQENKEVCKEYLRFYMLGGTIARC